MVHSTLNTFPLAYSVTLKFSSIIRNLLWLLFRNAAKLGGILNFSWVYTRLFPVPEVHISNRHICNTSCKDIQTTPIAFFPYPLKTSENIRGFLMGNYVVHVAFNGNKILSTFFYFLLVPSECKILRAIGW